MSFKDALNVPEDVKLKVQGLAGEMDTWVKENATKQLTASDTAELNSMRVEVDRQLSVVGFLDELMSAMNLVNWEPTACMAIMKASITGALSYAKESAKKMEDRNMTLQGVDLKKFHEKRDELEKAIRDCINGMADKAGTETSSAPANDVILGAGNPTVH